MYLMIVIYAYNNIALHRDTLALPESRYIHVLITRNCIILGPRGVVCAIGNITIYLLGLSCL